jgi:hypothetical protein
MLTAAVSGSFHRHMPAIYTAVGELRASGVKVLSPEDPRIVDHIGEFLFVASDRLRSILLVQDRHFEAIRAADFLWVVCPDGYTGTSTSAEIGFARAAQTPVFSDRLPLDITLQHYVRRAPSLKAVVRYFSHRRQAKHNTPRLLLEPEMAIESSMRALDTLKPMLLGKRAPAIGEAEAAVSAARKLLGTIGESHL